jgi:hypothetical protein
LKAQLSEPEAYAKRLQQLAALRADEEIEARRRRNHAMSMRDPSLREKRRIISTELAKRPGMLEKRGAAISKARKEYFEKTAERFEICGEMLNRKQIAAKYGLPYYIVKRRARVGKRGDELVAPIDMRYSNKPI